MLMVEISGSQNKFGQTQMLVFERLRPNLSNMTHANEHNSSWTKPRKGRHANCSTMGKERAKPKETRVYASRTTRRQKSFACMSNLHADVQLYRVRWANATWFDSLTVNEILWPDRVLCCRPDCVLLLCRPMPMETAVEKFVDAFQFDGQPLSSWISVVAVVPLFLGTIYAVRQHVAHRGKPYDLNKVRGC